MLIRNIHIDEGRLKPMLNVNSILCGYIADLILNLIKIKMKLTDTQLPDKRNYESYDNETERNVRLNQLRALQKKPES